MVAPSSGVLHIRMTAIAALAIAVSEGPWKKTSIGREKRKRVQQHFREMQDHSLNITLVSPEKKNRVEQHIREMQDHLRALARFKELMDGKAAWVLRADPAETEGTVEKVRSVFCCSWDRRGQSRTKTTIK